MNLPSQDAADETQPAFGTTVENCDAEPIHIPNFIQPHGSLMAFLPESGKLRYASANLMHWLPDAAKRSDASTIAALIGQTASESFREALLLGAGEIVRHHVVDLPARPEAGQPLPLEAVLHIYRGMAIAEIEHPATMQGRQDWAEMFGDTIDALRSTDGVDNLVERMAHHVKSMTRFDRVMVYRFHDDNHGQVVADAHEPGMESFLDLHYPASDIPSQARELYRTNLVRFIADVDYQPVPVSPWPDGNNSNSNSIGIPLDMSYAMLRSVSPIHLIYLRNMGVRSSLTISLLVDGELWGLIACHHRTPTALPLRLRRACSALSVCAGYMVSHNDQRKRISATMSLMHDQTAIVGLFNEMQLPLDEVVDRSATMLLRLASATGGAFWRKGQLTSFGTWPGAERGASIVASVQRALARSPDGMVHTDELNLSPPLLSSEQETVCGAMAIEFGELDSSGIVWIRPEFRREVTWGGNPAKSMQIERDADGRPRLMPRSSFARWRTLVEGRCRPWNNMDREAARAMLPLGQLLLVRESLALVSQSEGRFRDLVALQSDAYWQTNQQGRLLTMSKPMPAWEGAAEGMTLTELLTPSCEAASLIRLAQALAEHKPFRAMRILGKSPRDQKNFELVLSGEPLGGSGGQATGWHGTASDITCEVALANALKLQELAELSSKTKSKFLSHVSHELRTPLNAVLGFTQLMLLEKDASEEQLFRLKHVNTAGEWLLTMISDLLDLARFEDGPVKLQLAPVNARSVLEDAVGLVQQQAVAARITLISAPHGAPVWVQASAAHLKQVLINLTINAVKHNRVEGEVRVVIRPDSAVNRTRIEVNDTGFGLTPEQLTRLFQPFDKMGQSEKGVKGTGIGLVITKELVTAMGGNIEFESDVGKGTCVSVILTNAQAPRG